MTISLSLVRGPAPHSFLIVATYDYWADLVYAAGFIGLFIKVYV